MRARPEITPEQVRRIREERDLSLEEAAAATGVHKWTWQRWEAGKVKKLRRSMVAPVVALPIVPIAKRKRRSK